MISSESVSIFPLYYCFGFTVLYCKADQGTHTFAGLSSCPHAAALCLPVMLCIVGQHHAHSNNEMGRWLTWCREEVRCLSDIGADEDIFQMLDITQK